MYVLEGRELTREEMYEEARLDVERERAKIEKMEELKNKKRVYFDMSDPWKTVLMLVP